jgi:hypothetical protein
VIQITRSAGPRARRRTGIAVCCCCSGLFGLLRHYTAVPLTIPSPNTCYGFMATPQQSASVLLSSAQQLFANQGNNQTRIPSRSKERARSAMSEVCVRPTALAAAAIPVTQDSRSTNRGTDDGDRSVAAVLLLCCCCACMAGSGERGAASGSVVTWAGPSRADGARPAEGPLRLS